MASSRRWKLNNADQRVVIEFASKDERPGEVFVGLPGAARDRDVSTLQQPVRIGWSL
jgi:hypothetical protein